MPSQLLSHEERWSDSFDEDVARGGPERAGRFVAVERALADVAAGKAVVAIDGEHPENEGFLIFAAERATPKLVSFMVRHTSGYICVALTAGDCDRLELPPMYHSNDDASRTAFTVTVDAKAGITTGISATDRAHTIGLLAAPEASAADFARPGHVLPVRAKAGGVLRHPGRAEAAVDLARMAGLQPAAALCDIVSQTHVGDMARIGELKVFAGDHHLALVTIDDLIAYRRRFENQVAELAEARIPTPHGTYVAHRYQDILNGVEHIAMVRGDIGDGENLLVSVHFECISGDVFGSLSCDCSRHLDASLSSVAAEGRGVVLYMRGHEARRTGLMATQRACQLREAGAESVGANLLLDMSPDARDYGICAQILEDLGVRSMRLLTDDPDEQVGLQDYGLRVIERVPLAISQTRENAHYLRTRRNRTGYDLRNLATSKRRATDSHLDGEAIA